MGSTRKPIRPSTDKPLIITKEVKESIINCFENRNNQYFGAVSVILRHGEVKTGDANPFGGINLSDVARKSVNPRIKHLGVEMACRRFKKPPKNRYGNVSGQKIWGFYKL